MSKTTHLSNSLTNHRKNKDSNTLIADLSLIQASPSSIIISNKRKNNSDNKLSLLSTTSAHAYPSYVDRPVMDPTSNQQVQQPQHKTMAAARTAAQQKPLFSSALSAIAPQPLPTNNLTELTINQLDFQSLGVVGREEEVTRLQQCLDQITSSTTTTPRPGRQVILVSGVSGTGKTKLVNATVQDYIRRIQQQQKKQKHLCRPCCVQGKFEQDCRNNNNIHSGSSSTADAIDGIGEQKPFSGIIQACTEICAAISSSSSSSISTSANTTAFLQSLRQALQLELPLLCSVIPALAKLMTAATVPTKTLDQDEEEQKSNKVLDPAAMAVMGDSNPLKTLRLNKNQKKNYRYNTSNPSLYESMKTITRGQLSSAPSARSFWSAHSYNGWPTDAAETNKNMSLSYSLSDFQNRLFYAFVRFFRFLTSSSSKPTTSSLQQGTAQIYFAPLIVVLDDLQWADAASLELFHYLGTQQPQQQHSNHPFNNANTPNHILSPPEHLLVLVGIYRSNREPHQQKLEKTNNENTGSLFQQTIQKLRNYHDQNNNTDNETRKSSAMVGIDDSDVTYSENGSNFCLTEIHLENLKLDGVRQILKKLLGYAGDYNKEELEEKSCSTAATAHSHPTDWSSVSSGTAGSSSFITASSLSALAHICYKKTNGNIFFLLQYLSMLRNQQLLQFNLGTLTWTWNVETIESSTMACENVLALLRTKMNHFLSPPWLVDILKVAACLGSTFDFSILNLVWTQLQEQQTTEYEPEKEFIRIQFAARQEVTSLKDEGEDIQTGHRNRESNRSHQEYPSDWQQQLEYGLELLEYEGILMNMTTNNRGTTTASTLVQPEETYRFCHSQYSWVHDKIREAAKELIPESGRSLYGYRVGEILYSQLNSSTVLDSSFPLIFVVVNLLNGGQAAKRGLKSNPSLVPSSAAATTNGKSINRAVKNSGDLSSSMSLSQKINHIQLANLNYLACQKAISLSAFQTAADYVTTGIQFLPANAWEAYYELALSLYSTGAIVEGFLGNAEKLEQYCQQVLAQEEKPLEDKLDVYYAWIDSILNQGCAPRAVELSSEIVKKFGCCFPRNKILVRLGILKNVVKIKATFKYQNWENLNPMTDSMRMKLMQFLDKFATCLYLTRDNRMPLVVFRMLHWTAKYGHCKYSPISFATTGVLLTGILEDLQAGSRYGEHALVLLKKTENAGTIAARIYFLVNSFLFPWTKPIREIFKPLLEAYEMGLQSGDTESATWSILFWLVLKFMSGSSLKALQVDCFSYSKQVRDLHRMQAYNPVRIMQQAFLNLLGRNNADNPTIMIGDEISAGLFEYFRKDQYCSPILFGWMGLLMAYFGQHVRHADLIIEVGPNEMAKAYVASPNIMWHTFLKGVSCYAAARETGKRKYAKLGAYFRNKIENWIRAGNPNVVHYELLLGGEAMALKGKKFVAINKYKMAILLSARSGYQHDAAFTCERLAQYYLSKEINDLDEARYRLENAIEYWRGWGAAAKVKDIETRYSYLL